jgi:hypothetical protein
MKEAVRTPIVSDDGDGASYTMHTVTLGKVVKTRASENGVMAFHNGTEQKMVQHVESAVTKGDVEGLLAAVDEFCYSTHWMMHVGDVKGQLLDDTVKKAIASSAGNGVIVELGTYCGYTGMYSLTEYFVLEYTY